MTPFIPDKFAQERSAKRFINYVLGIVGHEHAKRRPFLATDCIRVWPYLGTALARQRAQVVQLCVLCVATLAIMATASYAVDHVQQGHSQE
jgi:hypothetical protein